MQDDSCHHPSGQVAKRVVIVDDSRSMRLWLRHVLDNETRLEVVGEAANTSEARAVIKETNPDVITLDIDMPGMDGLDFLDRLMRLHPLPVVMVSALTSRGSDQAIQAMSLGAVDCVVKPQIGDLERAQSELVRRVFSAACSKINAPPPLYKPVVRDQKPTMIGPMPIILIGASTGGVAALECVLSSLNPSGPPVLIVQHMPAEFLVSFSQMLNRKLPQKVGVLRNNSLLLAGQIMLAPAVGHTHTEVMREGGQWSGKFTPALPHDLHRPSVDALFTSAQKVAKDVVAVLLTGLGRDGAHGMKLLRDAGARTVGQDRASSVVYGMPRVAFESGAVEKQLPLDRIGPAVNNLVEAVYSVRKAGVK